MTIDGVNGAPIGSPADTEIGQLRRRISELESEKYDALAQLRPIMIKQGRHDLDDAKLGGLSRFIKNRIASLERTVLEQKESLAKDGSKITQLEEQHKLAERRRAVAEELARRYCRCGYVAAGNIEKCSCVAESAEEVMSEVEVPEAYVRLCTAALERFAEGYAEYGPGAADPLGLAGQWGDLHRKVMKLKRALWEGHVGYLTREDEESILQDIIGHCLLALEMLERGFLAGRTS